MNKGYFIKIKQIMEDIDEFESICIKEFPWLEKVEVYEINNIDYYTKSYNLSFISEEYYKGSRDICFTIDKREYDKTSSNSQEDEYFNKSQIKYIEFIEFYNKETGDIVFETEEYIKKYLDFILNYNAEKELFDVIYYENFYTFKVYKIVNGIYIFENDKSDIKISFSDESFIDYEIEGQSKQLNWLLDKYFNYFEFANEYIKDIKIIEENNYNLIEDFFLPEYCISNHQTEEEKAEVDETIEIKDSHKVIIDDEVINKIQEINQLMNEIKDKQGENTLDDFYEVHIKDLNDYFLNYNELDEYDLDVFNQLLDFALKSLHEMNDDYENFLQMKNKAVLNTMKNAIKTRFAI